MTVITTTLDYGEVPYGEWPYGTPTVLGNMGWQAQFVIADQSEVGMQAEFNIVDHLEEIGMQTNFVVADEITEIGQQAEFTIVDQPNAVGMQAEFNIVDHLEEVGMQANLVIADYLHAMAMEAKADTLAHWGHGAYGTSPYGTLPYGSERMCAFMGMQAEFNILDHETPIGMQAELTIVDELKQIAMQTEFNIVDHEHATGMQVLIQRVATYAMQYLATIYNVTNLRILCDFPSRGATTGAGLNAWGYPVATGQNWMANSTEAGDFSPFNLNTDIVEQIWRSVSTVTTGINLDCDTEIAQGVFLDTLAILNHNLTRAATVTLIGANDAAFTSVNSTEVLQYTEDNLYWIAPTLPIVGSRYWRISIDDVTNPDGFISIGTVIFGASEIFQGECFVDSIDFGFTDFADTVRTEGFTNVANSRALKRSVTLDFRSLLYGAGNFTKLRGHFKRERTILKCLWIPTPSATDMEVTDRYAVFGKMTVIPRERHNSKGPDTTYVDLTISVDESL